MDSPSLQNFVNFFGGAGNSSFSVTIQSDLAQLHTVTNALSAVVAPDYYDDSWNWTPASVNVNLNLIDGSYHDVHVRLQPGITVIVNAPDGSKTIVGGKMTVTAAGPDSRLVGTEAIFSGSFSSPTGIEDGPYSYTWTVVANNGRVVPVVSGSLSGYEGTVPDLTFTAVRNVPPPLPVRMLHQ